MKSNLTLRPPLDGSAWVTARVDAAMGAHHAFAYADEVLEIAVGVRGQAGGEARILLEFRGLDGETLDRHAVLMARGRLSLTSPSRPSLVFVSFQPGGDIVPEKVWLRLDPAPDTARTGVERAPLFDRTHYLAQLPGENPADPLAHYLTEGEARGLTPHPWFEPDWYRETYMVPTGREGSALLDYMTRATREPVRPHPLFDAEWYLRRYDPNAGLAPLDDFLAREDRAASPAAEAAGDLSRAVPLPFDRLEALKPHRISFHAPHLAEIADTEHTASVSNTLVTVMGIAREAKDIVRLERIVQDQTHPLIRLRIVDPGEDRARALNAALDGAQDGETGGAIAFLDADSDWRRDHLARLADRLETSGAQAVFCSWKRVEPTGRARWLGQAYDAESHAMQDMLPLTGWLHRPSTARFDGAAGDAMDWAYGRVLVADAGTPAWSSSITLERRQPADPGLDHRLRYISRDLCGWKESPAADGPVASVVMVLNGRFSLAQDTLAALIDADPGVESEILLVDNGMAERDLPLARDWARRFAHVRLVRSPQPMRAAVGANIGGLAARGAYLVFVAGGLRPKPGWLTPLIEGLVGASGAQPRLVSPDGRVRSRGLVDIHGEIVAPTEEVIAVRASDFRAVGGFDPVTADGPMMADLALRLAAATGRPFRVTPTPVVVASERALSFAVNVAADAWVRERWGSLTADVNRTDFAVAFGRAARETTPLRIALKVCFANEPQINSGDWHFASSLAKAIQSEGCSVRVDGTLEWYASPQADDVVLMLRGRWRYRPSPRHLNLMWVISHPDAVRPFETLDYDHIFTASPTLTARLGEGRGIIDETVAASVSTLLQCTDPDLFHPPAVTPEARGPVFVANSRGVERRIAHQAIEERLPVAIHGRQWDRFAARALVRGPGLTNAEVAELYRRSVVLNDHWADMRASGILSNRLFDAAACAAPVISDDIAGLEETFHGLISAWRPGEPLAPLIRAAVTEDDETRARRLALARKVMEVHSFAARAREIIAVARKGLARLAAEPNRRESAD